MGVTQLGIHHAPVHLGEPVVHARQHSEDGRQTHHHVEVGHYKVGVVYVHIQRRVGQDDPGQTAGHEGRYQTDRKQHGWSHADVSFPEGGDVVECLHRRWNRNQQGGEYKYCTQERVHTGHKHVVAPHDERQEADRQNRTNHSTVTEDGLTGVGGDDFRRDPQCRQQYDVDLRVSQEPEQVLVQDRRTTGHIQHLTADHNVRQVEGRAGHTVHHQQHHCGNQHWEREYSQDGGHKERPDGQRQAGHFHALGTQVDDGYDVVQTAEQR